MKVWDGKGSFLSLLKENKTIKDKISEERVSRAFDDNYHTKIQILFLIVFSKMNNIERKDLIYKVRLRHFSCEDENLVIQYFKDDTTANNAQKHSVILGKVK